MSRRITNFLREYIFIFSIITAIIGIFVLFMGVIWYFFKDLEFGVYTDMIHTAGEWNFYILLIGFIIFGIGIYYLYSYFQNRKFVLEELNTNKRSEFLKKHVEIKQKIKNLPSKYQKMLKEKEEELQIR
jgi:hypothetical protein